MNLRSAICGLAFCLSLIGANAQTFDVTQWEYSATHDLNSSGKSGQTFTTASSGFIYGVRLLVEGKNGAATIHLEAASL